MSKYINRDGTLKDEKIIMDINEAKNMYENGELLEARDVLLEIVNTIEFFENNN